ncbi:MAG: hypothetical protein JSR24_17390 [Proteobacteria bacterium]|nr:hypothetical protein [Pseudomonadota bacterium]
MIELLREAHVGGGLRFADDPECGRRGDAWTFYRLDRPGAGGRRAFVACS